MRAGREGFSLIEALVAMVLLAIIMMGLAPVLLQAHTQQRLERFRLEQAGILLSESNRLLATPFDDLLGASKSGCDAGDPDGYCITIDVAEPADDVRRIVVRVESTGQSIPTDSVVFQRVDMGVGTAPPPTQSPFNQP